MNIFKMRPPNVEPFWAAFRARVMAHHDPVLRRLEMLNCQATGWRVGGLISLIPAGGAEMPISRWEQLWDECAK